MDIGHVICLEKPAFYMLLEQVLEHVDSKFELSKEKQQWISGDEAMSILNIKSKTTLQELRNNGLIRFSQPQHKVILYDRTSILNYIEKHAREPF